MALPPYPASDFPDTPTAIVTGGASERGIGRATAHRLARDGWAVAVLDLDEAASQEVAAQIAREHGTPALGLGVDIADEQAVTAAVARIDAELPQLVGVVNNAGSPPPRSPRSPPRVEAGVRRTSTAPSSSPARPWRCSGATAWAGS